MIVIVGPIPPPVHGASVITERVIERLAAGNIPVLVCNTSPRPGTRGLRYHLGRIGAYLRCCATVARGDRAIDDRASAVYLSLSGGWGLLYDLAVVAVARLRRYDVILHHHTFHYITRPSGILRAIVKIAGERQRHIALCPVMAAKLARLYGSSLKIDVVSNLTFFDVPQGRPVRLAVRPLSVIGYLSSVSFEKGIDRFLDLMATLKAKGSRVTGLIAGPFIDQAVEGYVERRVREIGNLTYVGPVYGEQKAAFLSSIDLLVFPSRLNEAQPLVIFEAQAAGVPVAASEHGCIAQMGGGPASVFLLDPKAADLAPLIERIVSWEREPSSFQQSRQQARDEFGVLLEQRGAETARFDALFSEYR